MPLLRLVSIVVPLETVKHESKTLCLPCFSAGEPSLAPARPSYAQNLALLILTFAIFWLAQAVGCIPDLTVG